MDQAPPIYIQHPRLTGDVLMPPLIPRFYGGAFSSGVGDTRALALLIVLRKVIAIGGLLGFGGLQHWQNCLPIQ